ncbi:hypothetical protein ACEV9E_25295, partial [Vibrio parahaemolyticus]
MAITSSHAPSGFSLSVRTLLTSAVATISGLLIVSLLWSGHTVYSSYTRVQELRSATVGANDYINGVYELLMERLYTNNALQADAPASAQVRKTIDASR